MSKGKTHTSTPHQVSRACYYVSASAFLRMTTLSDGVCRDESSVSSPFLSASSLDDDDEEVSSSSSPVWVAISLPDPLFVVHSYLDNAWQMAVSSGQLNANRRRDGSQAPPLRASTQLTSSCTRRFQSA